MTKVQNAPAGARTMLKSKTYLITGASGFIGRALVRRLQSDGHAVRRALRIEPDNPADVRCPLDASVDEWARALDGVDGVFHLAWSTVPRSANMAPLNDLSTNLGGTVALLEAMRRYPGVPMTFVSSGGTVYGEPIETPISESHPLKPMSVYGASKASAETYALVYRRQFSVDARIVRLSNPFGPGQNAEAQFGAASVFAWRALAGRPIDIWGDGSIVRDYIYIDDTIDALQRMMDAPASTFANVEPVMNVGSGTGTSLLDIIRVIENLLGVHLDVNFQPARGFDVPINVLDITLAKRLLGWAPATSFAEGMRTTLAQFAENVADVSVYCKQR